MDYIRIPFTLHFKIMPSKIRFRWRESRMEREKGEIERERGSMWDNRESENEKKDIELELDSK